MFPVAIARSVSDEAIHASACRAMDCFASLAMTAENGLPTLLVTGQIIDATKLTPQR